MSKKKKKKDKQEYVLYIIDDSEFSTPEYEASVERWNAMSEEERKLAEEKLDRWAKSDKVKEIFAKYGY